MTILERLLQPVWEVSSDPIVVTGKEPNPSDRKILYVNQAFTQVNGYTNAEAIGRPLSLVHGAETDSAILRESEKQLREEQSQEYTLVHYRKDGSQYKCIVTRAPLVDADSAAVAGNGRLSQADEGSKFHVGDAAACFQGLFRVRRGPRRPAGRRPVSPR